MLLFFVSLAVGLVTWFLSLPLFFATGEETDRSMAEWVRPFMPWWGTKFGIWCMVGTIAGVITYAILPSLFPRIFVPR
jgi:hypothetical protein